VRQTMNRTSAAVAGSSLARAISHISRSMRTQNRGLRTQNRGHPRRIALARQTMNRTSAAVAGSSLARAISHISRSMRTRNRGHPRRTASAQQIGARQVMTRTHTPHSHLTSAAMREDTMQSRTWPVGPTDPVASRLSMPIHAQVQMWARDPNHTPCPHPPITRLLHKTRPHKHVRVCTQSRTWPAWPHGPVRIATHRMPDVHNCGARDPNHTLPTTHPPRLLRKTRPHICACVHREPRLASLAPRTRSHRDSARLVYTRK